MATAVVLPKVGMTMEEGTLVRWLAPDGAVVTSGQPLFEMETEKVEMEVEADADGVLHQLVREDTTLQPGDLVGCLLDAGEELPEELRGRAASEAARRQSRAEAEASTATAALAASAPNSAPARATPIARRIAAEQGIDLALVRGTGPEGRITERDVRAHIEALAAQPHRRSVPYAGRRRTVGEKMLGSLRSMAQVTLTSETPLGEALATVHRQSREWRRDGVVVTMTALLVRAAALALREHPRLNSRLAGDRIDLLPEVNIGFAVDLDEGLAVPVVRSADQLSLKAVAGAVADLLKRAKAGDFSVDDVSGGTFTVTSLESFRVDAFTPVINPPQVAILGVGRVRDVLALAGAGEVVKQQVTTLSLTFDHRVLDGAAAARFLDRVCELLERPDLLT